MTGTSGTSTPDEAALLRFLRVIASPDQIEVARMLALTPVLAVATVRGGAGREDPNTYWFEEIRHYVYTGDTGLHVAAAAHRPAAARVADREWRRGPSAQPERRRADSLRR